MVRNAETSLYFRSQYLPVKQVKEGQPHATALATSSAQDVVEKVRNAVLELLKKHAVLAGINLNELVKLAGVNRSLV